MKVFFEGPGIPVGNQDEHKMGQVPRVGEQVKLRGDQSWREVIRVTWYEGDGSSSSRYVKGWYAVVFLGA